jgi:hypothetical protein
MKASILNSKLSVSKSVVSKFDDIKNNSMTVIITANHNMTVIITQ